MASAVGDEDLAVDQRSGGALQIGRRGQPVPAAVLDRERAAGCSLASACRSSRCTADAAFQSSEKWACSIAVRRSARVESAAPPPRQPASPPEEEQLLVAYGCRRVPERLARGLRPQPAAAVAEALTLKSANSRGSIRPADRLGAGRGLVLVVEDALHHVPARAQVHVGDLGCCSKTARSSRGSDVELDHLLELVEDQRHAAATRRRGSAGSASRRSSVASRSAAAGMPRS